MTIEAAQEGRVSGTHLLPQRPSGCKVWRRRGGCVEEWGSLKRRARFVEKETKSDLGAEASTPCSCKKKPHNLGDAGPGG